MIEVTKEPINQITPAQAANVYQLYRYTVKLFLYDGSYNRYDIVKVCPKGQYALVNKKSHTVFIVDETQNGCTLEGFINILLNNGYKVFINDNRDEV